MTEVAAAPAAPNFSKVEADMVARNIPVHFDPAKHMCFEMPEKTHMLKDLDIPEETGISPVGITASFPLFTREGVRQLRKDLFRPDIIKQYSHPVAEKVFKLRGHGAATPFVYDAWHSEALRQACSQAARVELEVVFDYEIAQTNVQIDSGAGSTFYNIPDVPPPPRHEYSADESEAATDALSPIVAWHKDSYNFVCVVMLSDPTGMKGGETALRKGDGSIFKLRGPQMGWACMMQGSAITHVALRAMGGGERITMVTSFRPKGHEGRDGSTLRTVKKISNLDILFNQWSSYRMDLVARRANAMYKRLQESNMSSEEIKREMSKWVEEQVMYLKNTISEMN